MTAFFDGSSDSSSYGSISVIAENGITTWETPIDTSLYNRVSFFAAISERSDGNYSIMIEESDDSLEFSQISSDCMVLGRYGLEIQQDYFGLMVYVSVGVFSSKRFLRLSIVSSDVTDGATILYGVSVFGTIFPYDFEP